MKRRPADIIFSKDNRIISTGGFMFGMVLETKMQGANVEMSPCLPLDYDNWTWDIKKVTARLLEGPGLGASNPAELYTP
jgi:hypothetical protein